MTKFIATFLIMLIPTITLAEVPQITPLNKHQKAPFSGVLYNAEAVAELVAWKTSLIEQHNAFVEQLKAQLEANCSLLVSNIGAELDTCNDRYDQMIVIKDDQIKVLEDLALEKSNSNSHWWFGGGIVSGVLITVGVIYAVK